MFERIKLGLSRSAQSFTEQMNVLLDRGPDVDEEFWDGLEEALILSDVGAQVASEIVENMRHEATRLALPDAYAVMDRLTDEIASMFSDKPNYLDENPVVLLFVGINGAGKTTTVGKIAKQYSDQGRQVLLGSADTFRAAAIEQLEVWAERAGVQIVERTRGADPASVCYDTIEAAEKASSDMVLIDTAGRLHTSDDLMRELTKVVNVVRKRAQMAVRTVLVIDATTGQNGLSQARQFNQALDLDGVIVTKLDGTAKGGIALAISHELDLPVLKIGVGESLDDLQEFDATEFAAALIGAEPVEDDVSDDEVREPESPTESVLDGVVSQGVVSQSADEQSGSDESSETSVSEETPEATTPVDDGDLYETSEDFVHVITPEAETASDEGVLPETSSDEVSESVTEPEKPRSMFKRLFSWGRKDS